ncbi:MAG: hypothetical protein SGCHY_005189, partial [Lobulomycetales sp.]
MNDLFLRVSSRAVPRRDSKLSEDQHSLNKAIKIINPHTGKQIKAAKTQAVLKKENGPKVRLRVPVGRDFLDAHRKRARSKSCPIQLDDNDASQGSSEWSTTGGSTRTSPKMDRKVSSRGSLSRPASPARREQKGLSKEAAKNMSELFESPSTAPASPVTAGTSPKALEAPKSASIIETSKVLSDEKLRVPGKAYQEINWITEYFCWADEPLESDWRQGPRRSRWEEPQTPLDIFEPLKTTENAWKPKHLATKASAAAAVSTDDGDARVADLEKKITATLNKLAPERFERLSDDILNLDVSDPDLLGALLEKIFDKALSEAHYATMYAQLCYKLCNKLPLLQPWMQEAPDNKNNKFKRGLLLKCLQEFEACKNWAVEEAEAREQAKKGAENMTLEEREAFLEAGEKRIKSKIRSLGNIRFVGELFNLRIITEKVMHACVNSLLTNVTDPKEEAVESLCELMSTIGSYLESQTAVDHMAAYFERIFMLSMNQILPSRIRFMLLDLIELRTAGWKNRKGATGPRTLAEVRKDCIGTPASKNMDVHNGAGRNSSNSSRRETGLPRPHNGRRYSSEQANRSTRLSGSRQSIPTAVSRQCLDSRSFDRAARQGSDAWSTSGGSIRSSTKMERKGSSRGSLSRPASPAQREQKAPCKEATKYMFELLESPSSAAASPVTAGTSPETMEAPKSASKETPKVLSEEEKNLRVPSAVNEWFSIFDMT